MADVTQILANIRSGNAEPAALVPVVYEQLRQLAAQRLAHERAGHTLQVTALVNEAYLRLFGSEPPLSWENRAHFFGAAAEAMRRILVDYARQRHSQKRGGRRRRVELDQGLVPTEDSLDEILDVDQALEKLAEHDPVKAELVKLRYFAGLTMGEAAKMLNVSLPTANRYWAYARAWLYEQIMDGETDSRND